ncbi:unnamed protein product [Amoebophrya sp. A120]|nr:unnamed protein product [Amoebophrya sp. A120]|eukprot:GSA120T00011592001.1
MLFYQWFQTLAQKKADVTVELKNDLQIQGQIVAVDQFLNIRLNQVTCSDPDKFPYLLSLKNCFIRGSTLRYVHLKKDDVDEQQLQEATMKEATEKKMELQAEMQKALRQ